MYRHLILAIGITCVVTVSCSKPAAEEQDLIHMKSVETKQSTKPVIVILVDSLLTSAIDKGVAEHRLPTIQYLIEHGQYYKQFVSSFPTMSVTIDSSILTGAYADKHKIPGLEWYSSADQQVINYATGPKDFLYRGADPFLTQSLVHLNAKHLNKQIATVHEDLHQKGFTSGSINGIIYRGPIAHHLSIPTWMSGPTSLPETVSVKGPDFFTFGAFSNPLAGKLELKDNPIQRMGLNNAFAADTASYLIKQDQVPNLLLIYLPELDLALHKDGPSHEKKLTELDQQLKQMMMSYGSLDKALEQAVFVVMGDSGVSQVKPSEQQPVIDLPSLLKGYRILKPGDMVQPDTDLALAVNETMCYVYNLHPKNNSLPDIVNLLSGEDRMDLIAWKEGPWVYVRTAGTAQMMRYQPGKDLFDPYGQGWKIEQDERVMDLRINRDQQPTLRYGKYPDGLMRLYAALHSHEGEYLVLTAKMGQEFAGLSTVTHKGGGAHGSLHQTESLVPVLIGGTNQQPKHQRIVDLKDYFLQLVTGGQ